MKPKRDTKEGRSAARRPTLVKGASKRGASPRERMFRDAFLAERMPKKPLLSRERRATTVVIDPGTVALWVTLFLTVAYTLFFSGFHEIRSVEVSGTNALSGDDIATFVRGRLDGKRFGTVSRDNFFLVSEGRLRRELLSEFPILSDAVVRRRFPDAVSVTVSERERVILWCSAGPCSLLRDDGRAADATRAEMPMNEPRILRIVDSGARPVGIGEPVLSPHVMDSLVRLERSLRERSGVSFSATVSTPSRVSEEVRFTASDGWELLTSLEIDPEKTAASLALLFEKQIPENRRGSLRYVDLRTENRAFFAYRDGPSPESSTSGDSHVETENDGAASSNREGDRR